MATLPVINSSRDVSPGGRRKVGDIPVKAVNHLTRQMMSFHLGCHFLSVADQSFRSHFGVYYQQIAIRTHTPSADHYPLHSIATN